MPQFFTDEHGNVRPMNNGSGQLPVVFSPENLQKQSAKDEKERNLTRLKSHLSTKFKMIKEKRKEKEEANKVAQLEQLRIVTNELDEATDASNGTHDERYKALQNFALENRENLTPQNMAAINKVLGVLDGRRRADKMRDSPQTEKEPVKQNVPVATPTEPKKEPVKPVIKEETKTEKKESVEDKTNVEIVNR